jgi:hypothetical protein
MHVRKIRKTFFPLIKESFDEGECRELVSIEQVSLTAHKAET